MRLTFAALTLLVAAPAAAQASTPDEIAARLGQVVPMVLDPSYDLYSARSGGGALILTIYRTSEISVTLAPPHDLYGALAPYAYKFLDAPVAMSPKRARGRPGVRLDFGRDGCACPASAGTQSPFQVPPGKF